MPRHVIVDNQAGNGALLTGNETAAALGSSASFTGAWVDISQYESVIFAAKADTAGTIYAQFSNVGTEASGDATPSQLTYAVAANTNEVHRLLKTRQYFRIRYVNGSDAQSSFHIQCFGGSGGLLTSALSSSVQQDADALVTRAVPMNIELASGSFLGFTQLAKFGRNSDIDTGPEDIWEGGSTYTGQPTGSAETVEVYSSSASDTSGGTGARTVTITGLDASNGEQSESITLNGTTAVASSNTYNRVFRLVVDTAGSGGSNVGTLTCRHTTTTANVFAAIAVGRNQSSIAAYTVPAGKTLYIDRIQINMGRSNGSNGSANVTLRSRVDGGTYRSIRDVEITNSLPYLFESLSGALTIVAETDLKVRCESVSDTNTVITAEFSGVLVDD